ncbi:DUF402 domain-containing protein [Longispora albida]|uniref:DUF402 domain-containing protein n=1 Tax=Longispora albida TaxID=203523 RepID=UPI000371EEF2|nr:DUF402 domain-containing protein [Longispora albida]
MGFEAGQVILRRDVHRNGRIRSVHTARVISDDERGLLTWTGRGYEVMQRTLLNGGSVRDITVAERAVTPTMLSPGTWRGDGILVLTPPGAMHSLWWFFEGDGAFLAWYLNLETPAKRWSLGVDYLDLELDVVVQPDRSWAWKDEEAFAARIGHPEFWSAAEAEAIRAEGIRMIALAEQGAYPFDGSHTTFRPGPEWPAATLPPQWDLPAA